MSPKVSKRKYTQKSVDKNLVKDNETIKTIKDDVETEEEQIENDLFIEGEKDEEDEEDEEVEEKDSDNELLNYDNVDRMEKLTFDFEAFPPDSSDQEGLLDLITQIFLRVNIDCEMIAKKIVELSPFGCVFRPAEECEDDEIGSLVYGVLSAFNLLGNEKILCDIREFLMQRAKKHASKKVTKLLEELFDPKSTMRVAFAVNERMIHFPAAIAGPAFYSLKEDLAKLPKKERYDYVLLILKIRASDTTNSAKNDAVASHLQIKKKKLGKAEKKRLAEQKLEAADLIFDNAEESLIFESNSLPIYFQYPVQCDVEKSSKFHATINNGVIYRPYRRVCLLTIDQFNAFADVTTQTFSS